MTDPQPASSQQVESENQDKSEGFVNANEDQDLEKEFEELESESKSQESEGSEESEEPETEFQSNYEGVDVHVKCEELNYPPRPESPNFNLLEDNSLWADLQPIPRDSEQLFEINQDLLAVRCQSLLLSLLKKEEFSLRGFELSALAIKLNPADYSAWFYRSECLDKLQIDYQSELNFSRRITFESTKAYQPWNYRRNLCKLLNTPFNELQYVKLEIYSSPKNQCAWTYLTWLIKQFGTENLPGEFEFIEFLLLSDRYNNSAWNYKNFLTKRYKAQLGSESVVFEFLKDLQRLYETPDNEGLASYLLDMVEFVETFHTQCIAFVNEELVAGLRPRTQVPCLRTKYECPGPPSLCLVLAVKYANPTFQLYRILDRYKSVQNLEAFSIMAPMLADYYAPSSQ